QPACQRAEVVISSTPASTARPGQSSQVPGRQPTQPTNSRPLPMLSKEPQFHYVSLAENPELMHKLFDRTLDAPITLTQRELLAASADISRKYKDMVQEKRIVSTMVQPADDQHHEIISSCRLNSSPIVNGKRVSN